MKRLCLLLVLPLLLLTGCSRQTSEQTPWRDAAALDAQETPEQLYRQALEEGTLVVYTETSRIYSVKTSFEAQYPGLTVEVHHMRGRELLRLLEKNAETGNPHCDVTVCSDSDGVMAYGLVPRGILHKYVPWDMAEHIRPEHNGETLEFIVELCQVLYNDEVYDAPPVSNWWELTEEPWRGRVLIPNPDVSTSTFRLIATVLQNDEAMLEAYRARYGGEPPLPDGMGCGAYFLRQLAANGLTLTNSGTEVTELVGAGGQSEPPLGITVSSKVRNRELTLRLGVADGMQPFDGVYSTNSVMLADGGKNTSAAKLFVRWLLGERDGLGEGYRPYLQDCVWPVRDDVRSEADVALEELRVLQCDKRKVYEDREAIYEFWRSIMEIA